MWRMAASGWLMSVYWSKKEGPPKREGPFAVSVLLIQEPLGQLHLKVHAQMPEIVGLDGLVMESTLTRISADFSTVCMSPKVSSKSAPEQNMPWWAQMATLYFFISSEVATAMSRPPGTIQGTTPMPSGKTTGHSVAISQSSRVKASSVRGSTKVRAMVLAGWQW